MNPNKKKSLLSVCIVERILWINTRKDIDMQIFIVERLLVNKGSEANILIFRCSNLTIIN